MIANGDEQIFNSHDLPNPVIYFGFANTGQLTLKLRLIPMGCFVQSVSTFSTITSSMPT